MEKGASPADRNPDRREVELVRRDTPRIRRGALLVLVGTVEFLVGMAVAQVGYGASYSWSGNLISDLGVTSCGLIDGTGRSACSPWWFVFDGSLIAFGVLVALGLVLVRPAFPTTPLAAGGVGLLVVNAAAVGLAGALPENLYYAVHSTAALVGFAAAAAGLFVTAAGIGRSRAGSARFGIYTALSGILVLDALLLFATGHDEGLGPGGMERVVVAPVLLWFLVVGVAGWVAPRLLGGAEPRTGSPA